jgi:prevent-host-death family protein
MACRTGGPACTAGHYCVVGLANLAELVAEARRSHRPVTISEHGRPVAALINVDDLADLGDRAALAAHLADKAAGPESALAISALLDRGRPLDHETRPPIAEPGGADGYWGRDDDPPRHLALVPAVSR